MGRDILLLALLVGATEAFQPQRPFVAGRKRAAARNTRLRAADADLSCDCLVVGAGISGSTLAHNLHRKGINLLLTEARDYVGGNVISRNEVMLQPKSSAVSRSSADLGGLHQSTVASTSHCSLVSVGVGWFHMGRRPQLFCNTTVHRADRLRAGHCRPACVCRRVPSTLGAAPFNTLKLSFFTVRLWQSVDRLLLRNITIFGGNLSGLSLWKAAPTAQGQGREGPQGPARTCFWLKWCAQIWPSRGASLVAR